MGKGYVEMKIVRILNNNSIVAKDENQQEFVLLGAGLGFNKARGDSVDESKIEKKFAPTDDKIASQFMEMVKNISMDCILYYHCNFCGSNCRCNPGAWFPRSG